VTVEGQTLTVEEAIRARASVKKFTDRPIRPQEIEQLLELAVQAPNHRMTEPWQFLVLGDEARKGYARVLGRRKTKKVEDAEAADMVREKVMRQTLEVPAMLVVTMDQADDPEIREEDYAACWMAVQNLCLAAVARGLGTHIKSGAVMDDPELREAWRVPDDRRVIAILHLGEPDGEPRHTDRIPATRKTHWLE